MKTYEPQKNWSMTTISNVQIVARAAGVSFLRACVCPREAHLPHWGNTGGEKKNCTAGRRKPLTPTGKERKGKSYNMRDRKSTRLGLSKCIVEALNSLLWVATGIPWGRPKIIDEHHKAQTMERFAFGSPFKLLISQLKLKLAAYSGNRAFPTLDTRSL